MSALTARDFPAFFQELNGVEPFPWQVRLAAEVMAGQWPEAISLPTASGKTACIDVAIFALAAAVGRRQPRRILFVVDRRLVVDEAHARAVRAAERLAEAKAGVLGAVAERLRELAGGGDAQPLATAILRGGIYRDDGWVRSPLQPTVVLSTVDQIGSRLLFRGYGVSPNAWPIHAGLLATDSLLIVDEAHTSAPFVETLGWVRRYCEDRWAQRRLPGALQVVAMSATPVTGGSTTRPFTLDDADRAHPVLQRRLQARKLATLARAPSKEPAFVGDALKHATQLAPSARSVGVVVNRVATARAIHAALNARTKAKGGDRLDADVILLTGRVRPIARDALVAEVRGRVFSDPNRPGVAAARPLLVVATQCIEVGADLDFDALVTECAPIDALRQRFGRLDRLGQRGESKAVVLVREDSAPDDGTPVDDPVYGKALSRTWNWLTEASAGGTFDFGIEHFDGAGLTADLLTPTPSAPVLLPAHVDCWVQTSPAPHADPDPAVFLHGPAEPRADVQVVWRSDLAAEAPERWPACVAACPPSSPEAMSVPLFQFRAWLAGEGAPASSDVEGLEGAPSETDQAATAAGARLVLRWAGPDDDRTQLVTGIDRILPGDTLVVPAGLGGCDRFGWNPASTEQVSDLGDEAQFLRRTAILRLTPGALRDWRWLTTEAAAALAPLAGMTAEQEVDEGEMREALSLLSGESDAPAWLRALADHLGGKGLQVSPHPGGTGLVLSSTRRLRVAGSLGAVEGFSDDATSSRAAAVIPLEAHLEQVSSLASHFGTLLGLPDELVADLGRAGLLHDWGKADPRFQLWLAGGDPAALAAAGCLLAKSPRLPRSPDGLRKARDRSGYPAGGRHELLSVGLAQSERHLLGAASEPDLVLHLVATHHGRCRPLAPTVLDESPRSVKAPVPDGEGACSSDTRLDALDSGVLERFWRLVRRYGWWGLAYLEAILRLADQRASQQAREEA